MNYYILLLFVPPDSTRLMTNPHKVLTIRDGQLLYILHGRRGLLNNSFIYHYVALISCPFSTFIQP